MSTPNTTRPVVVRRRPVLIAAVAVVAAACVYIDASVGRSAQSGARAAVASTHSVHSTGAFTHAVPPALQIAPLRRPANAWAVVARVRGRPAAWAARRAGVTLMRFDQHLVHLSLHAGSADGGTLGWKYGDRITPQE